MEAQVREVESRSRGDRRNAVIQLFGPGDGTKLRPFWGLDFLPPGSGDCYEPFEPLPPGVVALAYQPGVPAETPSLGAIEWRYGSDGKSGDATALRITSGFRLWLAIAPTHLQSALPAQGYLPLEAIPGIGKIKVLLGAHKGLMSPLGGGRDLTCMDVTLAAYERWDHQPPVGHDVAWAFVYQGQIQMGNFRCSQELIVFKNTAGRLSARAENAGAKLLIGTAVKSRLLGLG